MRARVFLGFLTALAPFLAAGGASAQPAQPLDRLLPQIRREHPGQFLDAEGATTGGNPHYHLKWLTPDGRVIWLDADARSGRVMNTSPGRDSFDARPRAPEGDPGGPPDRSAEGRSNNPRYYDRPGEGRGRQNYRPDDGNDGRGYDRPNFGGRERGNDEGRFGGGFGRPGFGERGQGGGERGYGGGRDRGGDRR